jgi:hypothetical protein
MGTFGGCVAFSTHRLGGTRSRASLGRHGPEPAPQQIRELFADYAVPTFGDWGARRPAEMTDLDKLHALAQGCVQVAHDV